MVVILILEIQKKKMKSPFSELHLPNRLLDSIAWRMPCSQENLPSGSCSSLNQELKDLHWHLYGNAKQVVL